MTVQANESREALASKAFLKLANAIFELWTQKGSSDTRLLDHPWIPDELVTVGESHSGKDRREHLVPRMAICVKAHDMFSTGRSVEEVAEFIRAHVKIVLISKEEQERLDNKAHLDLRQKMPEGWTFETGDVFARLTAAGVSYRLYDLPC